MASSKKTSEFDLIDVVTDDEVVPLLSSGPSNKIAYAGEVRKNKSTQCSYTNTQFPPFANVKDALDYLLYTAPPLSLSFSVPSSTTILLGTTITTITLNWTLPSTTTLVSQSFNQSIGSISPSLRALTINGLSLTSDISYTLTVNDGTSSVSASAGLVFRNLYYIGTPSSPPTNSTQVRALSAGTYANGRQTSFISNPLGNYICFAYPSRFGEATINVNGLLNTAFTLQTIAVTNAAAFTENYYVYTSNTVQGGSNIQLTLT